MANGDRVVRPRALGCSRFISGHPISLAYWRTAGWGVSFNWSSSCQGGNDVGSLAVLAGSSRAIMAVMFTRRTFLQLVGASTAAVTGSEFLAQAAAQAAPGLSPNGLGGLESVVV